MFLQLRIMDPHRPPTNLHTVDDKVVVLTPNLRAPISQLFTIFGTRPSTCSTFPCWRSSKSCCIGAVKGWCELLHRPCAMNSLSSSFVNSGNSVTQRIFVCGSSRPSTGVVVSGCGVRREASSYISAVPVQRSGLATDPGPSSHSAKQSAL